MSEMIQHPITHKVLATDDKGEHHPQWFGSINGGESYIGLASEPEAGAYIELKSNTIPMSLNWPRGFRILSLTPVGEPVPVASEAAEGGS